MLTAGRVRAKHKGSELRVSLPLGLSSLMTTGGKGKNEN